MTVFGARYAELYDTLYESKDYDAECKLIASIFKRYGDGSIKRVVDFGCGTGNHAYPLADGGYDVLGVDRSLGMLARAKRKVCAHPRIRFRKGDVRSVRLGERFDAALLMFAVLGYQLTDDDVESTLITARAHLRRGGLLILDAWNGPAVISQGPSQRLRVIRRQRERVIRATSAELDLARHICVVEFQLWHLRGSRVVAEFRETHQTRYFFPNELRGFMNRAGFEVIRFGGFPDFENSPSEDTWNMMAVGRAC